MRQIAADAALMLCLCLGREHTEHLVLSDTPQACLTGQGRADQAGMCAAYHRKRHAPRVRGRSAVWLASGS